MRVAIEYLASVGKADSARSLAAACAAAEQSLAPGEPPKQLREDAGAAAGAASNKAQVGNIDGLAHAETGKNKDGEEEQP